MPVPAMSLAGVHACRVEASAAVLAVGDGFHVVRVDAASVAAEVVYLQPGNRPN
jgi:hypothetical protein